MKTAIITVAGISTRFNMGLSDEEKILKCIYTESTYRDTLLYDLVKKCSFADKIIIVGGYMYDKLNEFCRCALREYIEKVVIINNLDYEEYSSGYSLFLGINEALEDNVNEIIFVEGDLDIDDESFELVKSSNKTVLTYTNLPIYAERSVVLYKDKKCNYKYLFNCDHGLLRINEPFSCIYNSGQVWKFKEINALRKANDCFATQDIRGTNLSIIQKYINTISNENIELINLKHWVNCNTRDDYRTIMNYRKGLL